MTQEILRLKQVKNRCGLGRSSIYQKMKDGEFPRPIFLSKRAVGWVSNEIDSWITSRIEASRVQGGSNVK